MDLRYVARRVAIVAVVGMVASGLSVAPASAQQIDDVLAAAAGPQTVLYSQYSGAMSTRSDGVDALTDLQAGSDSAFVRFEYSTGGAYIPIQTVPVSDGFAETAWAPDTRTTNLRAVGITAAGAVEASDTTAVSFADNDAARVDGATRDLLGAYVNPTAGSVSIGVTGKGTAVANDVRVLSPSTGAIVATGQIAMSGRADPSGLYGIQGVITMSASQASRAGIVTDAGVDQPDDVVVGLDNSDLVDDTNLFSVYRGVVSSVSAAVAPGYTANVAGDVNGGDLNAPGGGGPDGALFNDVTAYHVTVLDQTGRPLAGVPVYESNASGVNQSGNLRLVDGTPAGANYPNGGVVTGAVGVVPVALSEGTMDNALDHNPAPNAQTSYVVIDVNGDGSFQNGSEAVVAIGAGASGPARRLGDVNGDGKVNVAILGDSYIAGEGAAQKSTNDPETGYEPCTSTNDRPCATAGTNQCHRSKATWAWRLAKESALAADDVLFAACSGAVTRDITEHGQYDGQDDRDGPSPAGVLGGARQLDPLASFDAKGPTDLVLLSIGGNDAHFAGVVTRCLLSAVSPPIKIQVRVPLPLGGSITLTINVGAVISAAMNCRNGIPSLWRGDEAAMFRTIRTRIENTIDLVQAKASKAQVVVVGYPDPTSGRTCGTVGGRYGITKFEQDYIREEFLKPLNDTVEAAARAAGGLYFDVESAFRGRGLCEANSYMNGVTIGNDLGPIGSESFHPNVDGHARLLEVAKSNLITRADFGVAPARSVVRLGRAEPASTERLVVPAPSGAESGEIPPGATVTARGEGAPAGSSGIVVINSVPTEIGTWRADASGDWRTSIQVPASTATGLQIVTALTADGTEVGTTMIWVGAHEGCAVVEDDSGQPDSDRDGLPDSCDPAPYDGAAADTDGDGVTNLLDSCPTVPNRTQTDRDGIGLGDACDVALGHPLSDTVRQPDNAAPRAPQVDVDVIGAGSVRVSIAGSDPDDAADALVHRCSLDGGPARACADGYELLGLATGQHSIEVTTSDLSGNVSSPTVATFDVTVSAGVASPTSFRARSGNGSARLSWTGTDDATGYRVTVSPGGRLVTVPGDRREVVVKGLRNGRRYGFSIVAFSGSSTSAAVTTSTTPAGPPGRVSRLRAVVRRGRVVVTWGRAAANGASVSYRVSVVKRGRVVRTVRSGGTRVSLPDLGGPLLVKVYALNHVGRGPTVGPVRVRR